MNNKSSGDFWELLAKEGMKVRKTAKSTRTENGRKDHHLRRLGLDVSHSDCKGSAKRG